ncbi:MAG TPA: prolyl oligopeptidase family serine peptidase [Bacteroidales bacterium]|nr:prolyl oligopeptidase family serine peptidase [Bacteroidales bacterium]
MKKIAFMVLIAIAIVSCKSGNDFKNIEIQYVKTKTVDVSDDYFGTKVTDPYRWLENDTAADTEQWVKDQNKVTQSYFDQIPFRKQILERLTKLWDFPKESAPMKKGDKYFLYKNNGLQNQNVLYYKTSLIGEDKELLDPNALSEDGTVSLASTAVSDDGKYLAYAISRGGSDWSEIFVRDIATGKDLADHLEWIKFSGMSWFGNGFFYSRYPEPQKGSELSGMNMYNKLYYHTIGEPQANDKLIYEDNANPQRSYSAEVTEDQKYLIIYASESTSGNALYYKDLTRENAPVRNIVDGFKNDYGVIGHFDGLFYVYTNDGAPRYKLITIDPKKPDAKYRKDLIAEAEGVLQSVAVFGNRIIATYMEDAHSVIKIYDRSGKYLADLDQKFIGTVSGFSGESTETETFYTITSFTTPATIYKYDIEKNKSELYKNSQIDFDASAYETKQIFYTSKDGTKVPMFIVHKKGIALDGSNPTLLYGYGGFNISLTPFFSVVRLIWLEQGGVLAIPNIRGGGEYGEDWHKAGTLMNKQNVFDDFIAAAEYLIKEKYTSPNRLGIQGGSNGGLLVGAVSNQRPDLFAVALPAVGVMDMLRYHLFTIGRYWATDYGTSADSKEMFEYLYKYSPLHNIKEGVEYPATLVTTADHDDRVVPAHSFKYIATLQAKYKGQRPMLIRIETKAGHGAGKPTDKIIQEYADVYAFTFYNMKFTPLY